MLDFLNDADTIQASFAPFYRTTVLAEETDPNRLHDLKAALDDAQVYEQAQIDALVARYLSGAERDQLDPILDACVAAIPGATGRGCASRIQGQRKGVHPSYGFLSSILPYTNAEWEKLSILLNFLVSKLPAPVEEDLSKGILEAIHMDSYRVEKQAAMRIQLPDAEGQIEPVPTSGGAASPNRPRTYCPISCRSSTTSSATLTGPMPTVSNG